MFSQSFGNEENQEVQTPSYCGETTLCFCAAQKQNINNYVPRKTMQKKNDTSHMSFTSNFISLFELVVEGSCLVSPHIALCMSGEIMQRQNDVIF